jgi:hypothetical protein
MKTAKEDSVAGIYRQGLSITGWTEKTASHKVWERLGYTTGTVFMDPESLMETKYSFITSGTTFAEPTLINMCGARPCDFELC